MKAMKGKILFALAVMAAWPASVPAETPELRSEGDEDRRGLSNLRHKSMKGKPTRKRTRKPKRKPTMKPTKRPIVRPSKRPTLSPTFSPSASPTLSPTVSFSPSASPSLSCPLVPCKSETCMSTPVTTFETCYGFRWGTSSNDTSPGLRYTGNMGMYPRPFSATVKGNLSFPYFGGTGTAFELACGAGGELRFSPSFAGICGNVSACYMIGNGVLTPGIQFPDCAAGTVDCGIPIVKTERESVKSLPCLTFETGNVTISGSMSNESDSNTSVQRSSNSTEAKAVGFRLEAGGLVVARTTTGPDHVMSMSDKALALCTGLSNPTSSVVSRGTITVGGTPLGAFTAIINSNNTNMTFFGRQFSRCAYPTFD